MRVEQDLRISGEAPEAIAKRIVSVLANGWKHEVTESGGHCFSKAGAGKIYFKPKAGSLELVHAMLDHALQQDDASLQVNQVIQLFHDEILAPSRETLGLQVALTPENRTIEDLAGPRTGTALATFAAFANKQAPSNPSDRICWFDFLVTAHSEASTLDAVNLERYLTEKGFIERARMDLRHEYEFARGLLRRAAGRIE